MMKTCIPFLLLSLLLITSCSLLDSSDGSSPDLPGKLVFAAQDSAGTSQIFTMKADGSELQQLTHFAKDGDSVNPAWSPDGQQIIFSSFKFGTSNGPALWVMDADGGNRQVLYDAEPDNPHVPPLLGNHARWSPDGTKIAFDLCLNCQLSTNLVIYVFDLATKQRTRITEEPAGYKSSFPAWSPDGTRIAFIANRDYIGADTLQFRQDLYVMDADGSNQWRVTETGYARNPIWNPDGNAITFRSSNSDLDLSLFQADIQSGNILKIKEDLSKSIQLFPMAWSPDRQELLITTRDLSKPQEFSMYLVDTKKDQTTLIPFGPAEISGADWFISTNR